MYTKTVVIITATVTQCFTDTHGTICGTQQYRALMMIFQYHTTLSMIFMMLSQCPIPCAFPDILGLVSCAFSPIFHSQKSLPLLLEYQHYQSHPYNNRSATQMSQINHQQHGYKLICKWPCHTFECNPSLMSQSAMLSMLGELEQSHCWWLMGHALCIHHGV